VRKLYEMLFGAYMLIGVAVMILFVFGLALLVMGLV